MKHLGKLFVVMTIALTVAILWAFIEGHYGLVSGLFAVLVVVYLIEIMSILTKEIMRVSDEKAQLVFRSGHKLYVGEDEPGKIHVMLDEHNVRRFLSKNPLEHQRGEAYLSFVLRSLISMRGSR